MFICVWYSLMGAEWQTEVCRGYGISFINCMRLRLLAARGRVGEDFGGVVCPVTVSSVQLRGA